MGATLLTISITSHLILCMFYKDVSVQKHISLFPPPTRPTCPSLAQWTFSFFLAIAEPHCGSADSIANMRRVTLLTPSFISVPSVMITVLRGGMKKNKKNLDRKCKVGSVLGKWLLLVRQPSPPYSMIEKSSYVMNFNSL